MAITFIYPIKVTGDKSLDYDTADKDGVISKNDSKDSLEYVIRDKRGNIYNLSEEYLEKMKNYISKDSDGNIIFHTIKNSINCSVDNAYKEWELVRKTSGNKKALSGNIQYCIVQNFGNDIDPKVANSIGIEFAQKYLSDYQVVVSTHINTGHVHNHIEFNATSFCTHNKFNDDLKCIQDIRRISDELCLKYELDVLEETRDFNYIIYKDSDGRTKIYEPTERKNTYVEGEYKNKNDYRNTSQYKKTDDEKKSHIDELKNDIDRLIPYVESFEDLLEQLRNINYEIKDKNKNGEWRKHISFKAPSWDKFVRDNSLGYEYERVQLTERIKKEKQEQSETIYPEYLEDNINVSYVYGSIDIESIDENYRYKKKHDGYIRSTRNEIEKSIISDTKILNREVDLIRRQAMYVERKRDQELLNGNKKQQYLIDRINGNLKTLKFVEDKNIKSIEQITSIVKSLYEKRDSCYSELNIINRALKQANANIALMEKYNSLKTRVNNSDLNLIENKNDMELLKSFSIILKEKDLLDEEKQNDYKMKYDKYMSVYSELAKALEKVNKNIKAYDDCIYNIGVVDKDGENKYQHQIQDYYDIREEYKNNNQRKKIEKER